MWRSCSAKLRWAGVGLKSYLSSGKSSAMAMSLRPISFQESRTTLAGGSAGLGAAASFFVASCACAGIAKQMESRARARNGSLFMEVPPDIDVALDIVLGRYGSGKDSASQVPKLMTWARPSRTRETAGSGLLSFRD